MLILDIDVVWWESKSCAPDSCDSAVLRNSVLMATPTQVEKAWLTLSTALLAAGLGGAGPGGVWSRELLVEVWGGVLQPCLLFGVCEE